MRTDSSDSSIYKIVLHRFVLRRETQFTTPSKSRKRFKSNLKPLTQQNNRIPFSEIYAVKAVKSFPLRVVHMYTCKPITCNTYFLFHYNNQFIIT